MAKKRILVVDYEPKSLDRILEGIPEDRYEVATARDGLAALEEFGTFQPDLVFLRTMLPKKHGFQVCQEMVGKGGGKPVPVVMHCSIYKSRKYKTDAMKIYGAADYLEDPIEDATIAEILDKYLGEEAGPAPPPDAAGDTPGEAPPEPPPEPAKPKPAKKKAAAFDVDNALEETLSGLSMGAAKKKKKKAEAPAPAPPPAPAKEPPRPEPPKPEPPKPEPPKPEPPKPEPPKPEPPKPPEEPPAPEAPPPPDEPVTSEEIFGDVIDGIEAEDAQAEPPPPPPEAKPEPPKPAEPSPAKKAPKIDVDKAIGGDLLGDIAAEETKTRAPKKKAKGDDISKKLEETLSGVQLGGKKPAKPAPKPLVKKEPEPPPKPPAAEKPAPPEEKPAPAPEKKPEPEKPKPEAEKKEPPPPPKPEKKEPEPPPPEEKTPVLPGAKVKPEPVAAEAKEEKIDEEGVAYGKYILVEKIAVGGMAELFKAKQKGLEGFQRIVAIKRILPHLAANQDFVTMFIDEAKLAAQLNHPNIGHIYDLGKIEDSYFIAMEYIEGKDLRTIIRECAEQKKTLPEQLAVFIAQRLCSALHYAHTAKDADRKAMSLVHRDISPQNILISTSGEVKLVDFGIAKAASKASHTVSGALKGKLLYMSPEQAWGKDIDLRTDIFSLGTVLFEMLTGEKLFSGDSEMSILEKVRDAKVRSPKDLGKDIPDGLEKLIMKALQKEPDNRFKDCRTMQEDLEQFCYGEWTALPSPYEVVAFFHELFPKVYTEEALKELKSEAESLPETTKMKAKPELKKEARPAPPPAEEKKEEPEKAPEPPPKKKKRGKAKRKGPKHAPAPLPPKDEKPAPAPPPKKEKPAPRKEPAPPKKEEPEEKPMFGSVADGEKAGSKKGILFGIIGLVVVVAIILAVVMLGGKEEKKPAPAPEPEVTQPPPPPVEPIEEEPPPEEPAAEEAGPSEEELQAARQSAADALTALSQAIQAADQAGAAEQLADRLSGLQGTYNTLQGRLGRAQSMNQIVSVRQIANRELAKANQLKTDAEAAVVAAREEQARREAEAEEARREAEEARQREEEARRAEEEAQAAQQVKAGDFIESWALDVKPKAQKEINVRYTSLARRQGVEGTIYYEVAIDETGNVTDVKIVKGLSADFGLHDAVIKAARETRFSPGIKDGVPVKTKLTLSKKFKMN